MGKLSELKTNENKKVLIYGQSGTGKTIFSCSFPGPIYVADFDGKISSAATFYKNTPQIGDIEFDSFVAYSDFNKFYSKISSLKKIADDSKKAPLEVPFPFKTVILDSITTFSNALMKEVIRQNPSSKRTKVNDTLVPFLPDYQIAISHFKDIIMTLLSLPCNFVATGHIQTSKDEMTGEILNEPLIYGKDLPSWLPVVFEEVYRSFTETVDGKTSFMAQSKADRKYIARTQLQGIPEKFKLSYEELKKYF